MPSAGNSSADDQSRRGKIAGFQTQGDPLKIPLFKSTPTKPAIGDFRKLSTSSPLSVASEISENNRLLTLLKLKNARAHVAASRSGVVEFAKKNNLMGQEKERSEAGNVSVDYAMSESNGSFQQEVTRLIKESSAPIDHLCNGSSSPLPRTGTDVSFGNYNSYHGNDSITARKNHVVSFIPVKKIPTVNTVATNMSRNKTSDIESGISVAQTPPTQINLSPTADNVQERVSGQSNDTNGGVEPSVNIFVQEMPLRTVSVGANGHEVHQRVHSTNSLAVPSTKRTSIQQSLPTSSLPSISTHIATQGATTEKVANNKPDYKVSNDPKQRIDIPHFASVSFQARNGESTPRFAMQQSIVNTSISAVEKSVNRHTNNMQENNVKQTPRTTLPTLNVFNGGASPGHNLLSSSNKYHGVDRRGYQEGRANITKNQVAQEVTTISVNTHGTLQRSRLRLDNPTESQNHTLRVGQRDRPTIDRPINSDKKRLLETEREESSPRKKEAKLTKSNISVNEKQGKTTISISQRANRKAARDKQKMFLPGGIHSNVNALEFSSRNQSELDKKLGTVSSFAAEKHVTQGEKSNIAATPNISRRVGAFTWKSRRLHPDQSFPRSLKECVVDMKVANGNAGKEEIVSKEETGSKGLPQSETHPSKLELVGLLESDADNETDNLSSAVSDLSSDAFDVEQELLTIRSAQKIGGENLSPIHENSVCKANTAQSLPAHVHPKSKQIDPETERRRLERLVGRELTARVSAISHLTKENLICFVETGIAKHTPFEAGLQVTGSNDICNINNYEITPVLYLQYLSKGGRLSFAKFENGNPPESFDYSVVANLLKDGRKVEGSSMSVYFDTNCSQDNKTTGRSLVQKRLSILKTAFGSINAVISPVFSANVDVVVVLSEMASQDEKAANVTNGRATILGRRIWSYEDAVDFLRDLKVDISSLPENSDKPQNTVQERALELNNSQDPNDSKLPSPQRSDIECGYTSNNRKQKSNVRKSTRDSIIANISNQIEGEAITKEQMKSHILELIKITKEASKQRKRQETYWLNELKAREKIICTMSDEVIKDQMKLASLNGQITVKDSELKNLRKKLERSETELEDFKVKLKKVSEGPNSFQLVRPPIDKMKHKHSANSLNSNDAIETTKVGGDASAGNENDHDDNVFKDISLIKKILETKTQEVESWKESHNRLLQQRTHKLKLKDQMIEKLGNEIVVLNKNIAHSKDEVPEIEKPA